MTYLVYAFCVLTGILLSACMRAITSFVTNAQITTIAGSATHAARRTHSKQNVQGRNNRTRQNTRHTPNHRDKQHLRKWGHVSEAKDNKPKYLNSQENVDLPVVVVPIMAIGKFLSSAQVNTECNIETCGLLVGKNILGQFHVTHVLVPKQHGTPDSCTTFGEEDIVNFHEQESTLTLGWIHTHPKQTSFLSSLDLHTQCGFEMQFASAVAIVCSIEKNKTSYFSLTEYGRKVIHDCRNTGFHEHSQTKSLYQSNPKHLVMDRDGDVILHDMR